jgi:hypothetical protein
VRAQPGREPERAQLEHAAERLVALAQHVDLLDHRAARVGVEAADRRLVDRSEVLEAQVASLRRPDRPDLGDVRDDLRAERAQERLRQRAPGDARGGLPGARALEHVADVVEAELPCAREVRVPGPRQVHLGHRGLDRPRAHALLPVGVVTIGDLERDGAADRSSVTDAGGDLGRIALDLHPPAAAVAELAPRHVAVHRFAVELQPGGQALDDAGEPGAVALPGGDESQRHARKPIRPRARRCGERS